MVNDIHKLPSDLCGEKICTKNYSQSCGFFGQLHPLSNFHPTKFEYQGYGYHSSKQMIQHLKAVFYDVEDIAEQVLSMSNALE